jgi:TldD protein
MAALLTETLGTATQLDRALGYEANAAGTSFLTDPLDMVGKLQVASPLVTVTANRSAPTQLATVKWDTEGVVPQETTLVKDGVLADFQTTREQVAWLAPYYAKTGMPVCSHGYAAAEDALVTTIQMLPNLALAPNPAATQLEDLIANVQKGILITGGSKGQVQTDSQARTGLLWLGSGAREITNGRLGRPVSGGAVQFNTLDFWKKVAVLGGKETTQTIGQGTTAFLLGGHGTAKGQPSQGTSYTAQAVAATILDQPVVNPARKA